MNVFFTVLCFILAMAVPASASEVTETVPVTTEAVTAASEFEPVTFSVDGGLSGGYYFVCSCALGDDVKFYIPLEWAHDAFSLDDSGAPVNMSSNTCYAYCPQFPDYTFSCSRFNTFTYRADGYSTSDLNISDISDTNISFMADESYRLSDSDLLFVIACLLFLILVCPMILRRR